MTMSFTDFKNTILGRLCLIAGIGVVSLFGQLDQVAAQQNSNSLEQLEQQSAAELYREFVKDTELPDEQINGGWWVPLVSEPLRESDQPLTLTLDEVILRALQYSQQIKVFSELPLIRRTAITEADAVFDWTRYWETRWDDLNDPVGSTLTVGGTGTRYINQQWTGGVGLRRRNSVGGEVDLRQNIGWQETNSNFFVPNPQGTARFLLGYTQPLMRGRGRTYNQSLICLAEIDARIADDEFRRQLQTHLLEVTRAYWALYLERGVLFQKMSLFNRAQQIFQQLEKRIWIDAQQTQILSARASVTARRSELIRAQMAVKNAESRLRSLVNDPEFGEYDSVELVPLDVPSLNPYEADIRESMQYAVQFRPEVLQALKQIKAGSIRLGMSRNELLPQLDLVTQSYVAGLQDGGSIGDAWTDQFSNGRPGYSIGLNYQIPFGNRASAARNLRRQLELRQLNSQYQTTLVTVKLEVEVACREIQTSSQELIAKSEAMNARALQLESQMKRWKQLPGEDISGSLALENLLDTQDRLALAEFEFLEAQLTFNLAQMNLKRVTGLLLRTEGITIGETTGDCLPTMVLQKGDNPLQFESADRIGEPSVPAELPTAAPSALEAPKVDPAALEPANSGSPAPSATGMRAPSTAEAAGELLDHASVVARADSLDPVHPGG